MYIHIYISAFFMSMPNHAMSPIYEARGHMLGGIPCLRYCTRIATGMGWIRPGNVVDLLGTTNQDGDDNFICGDVLGTSVF